MIEEVLNHLEVVKSRLLSQYRDKPNLEGMIASYVQQIQELETVFMDILAIIVDFDNQEGAQLDLIGKIVGQAREGKSDPEYLKWIKLRVFINRSSGLPDELAYLLSQILPQVFSLSDDPPAGLVITSLEAVTDTEAAFALDTVNEIRPGGVRYTLVYSANDDSSTFRFSTSDTIESGSSQGFQGRIASQLEV